MNLTRRIDQTLATANRRRLRRLLLIVPVIVTAYLLAAGDGGVPVMRRQNLKIADLEREISDLRAENHRLRAGGPLLHGDLRSIEKIARERYAMVMDGESVYMVYPKDVPGAKTP